MMALLPYLFPIGMAAGLLLALWIAREKFGERDMIWTGLAMFTLITLVVLIPMLIRGGFR